jgi:hypothetical protein
MGLPICHLTVGLRQFGMHIPLDLDQRCQKFLNYECPNLVQILAGV